jgi:hypothetical protein
MSVLKLKPARTPRVMDEWTEENALACEESKHTAKNEIERSRQLIEQSKEIKAQITARLNKTLKKKAG